MQPGGAEQVLLDLSRFLAIISPGSNINLTVTTDSFNGFFKSRYSPLFRSLVSIDEVSSTPLGRLLGAWTLICINKPACILIQSNPHLYALTPVIKRFFPETKIVDLIHCQNQSGDLSWFDLADYYSQSIDIRIVISSFHKHLLCGRYQEASEKVLVLPAELTTMHVKNDTELAARADSYTSKKTIGFLGRLAYQKQPLSFLKLASLYAAIPEYSFLLGGDGPLRKVAHEEAQGLSNLKLTGLVASPIPFLKECDLVVFFSIFEGLPLVLLECASLGIPVIAPSIPGFEEPIRAGSFGLLFRPEYNNTDHIKVGNLIEEYGFDGLQRLGRNGPKYIAAYHPPYVNRPGLRDIFYQLASRSADIKETLALCKLYSQRNLSI